MTVAADIANRALDAAGSDKSIGELEEGCREAQVCLRHYAPALMRLSRAAHWDCLRKQAPLLLLGDATGQTANAGNQVPAPWMYEYAYPIDCMKARFLPWSLTPTTNAAPPGNIAIGQLPIVGGLAQAPVSRHRLRPARFLVGTDTNYPATQPGMAWQDMQGVSPTSRTVILTNVQGAQLIYTGLIAYPNMWDALFQDAIVALLASEIALPLAKDKRMGLQLRAQQIAIAKEKIAAARVSDGNESWSSSDISVDWMRTRHTYASRGWDWSRGDGGGAGVLGYGWDSCSFGDGSAY